MASVSPPGIDHATFQKILQEFSDIVGEDNVSRDASYGSLEGPHGQHTYGDPYVLQAEKGREPSAAIRPSVVSEVQAIVRVANRYKCPLWTVSRGKNLGYGGTSPVVRGSVILDLHRMNKIIEVNEEYAYAIVEPGVSFFDLYKYVQENNLKLWPSCPAIGWGSVLGNTLERGFGYTPNGEHSQQQCGMEVVLPSGEVVRTGMGAMENSKLFALFKGGFGPSIDGLFYQSNLGIVTQLGIHLTPAPEHYMTCGVSVPNEEDLPFLVSTISDLMRRNIITNSPSVSNVLRQCLVSRDSRVLELISPHFGKGCVPEKVLLEVKKLMGWGFWKAQFALYGPVELVKASWTCIERKFSNLQGSILWFKEPTSRTGDFLTTAEVGPEDIPHSGIPNLEPLLLMNYRGPGAGHTCFSPILPPSGRELYAWYQTAKKRTIDAEFDFFADFHIYARYVIAIELVVFKPAEGERCSALYEALLEDAVQQGYSEYRTHVDYMDIISHHFDFNKGTLRKHLQVLKDVLDPNGVVSPGKSGIWNSNMGNVGSPV
ncbi:hypothetical protein B0O99DRAFT_513907 [Bisporella sp. PMI_857]|nr:hypothetical protein B0O99DRAFT_513907 [Bisporella sp. PMI_857]